MSDNTQRTPRAEALNQVDVAFVIDTTGSMGSFLNAAKRQLRDTLAALRQTAQLDLRVGLVEYRDHPPQDGSFITRNVALTGDLDLIQKKINNLAASGGGDEAEAVLRGVHDACEELAWRKHSVRHAFLVGDAPPHGYTSWRAPANGRRANDSWSRGCPSGLDVRQVAAMAETRRITLHAICMNPVWYTRQSFEDIALGTGGTCTSAGASDAIDRIVAVLREEVAHIPFDARLLTTLTEHPDASTDDLAARLDTTPRAVTRGLTRLHKRDLLPTTEQLVAA